MFTRLGQPMNRYTLRFFLAICANADFPFTRNFEIRRQVLRVKKMTKFKKKQHTHMHLSLSLYLPIRRCTPERMCMHQSLSLSFSVYICKNGLDPDQTRMELRKECFANRKICACYWKYAKPMRIIRWVFSIYIGQSHAGQGSGGPENHKI